MPKMGGRVNSQTGREPNYFQNISMTNMFVADEMGLCYL